MHPLLLEIGGFRLGTWGVALGVGLAAASVLALRLGGSRDRDLLLDVGFWGLLAAMAGARLAGTLLGAPLTERSAGASVGALLAGFAAVVVVARGKRALPPLLDLLAPPALLALAFTRVGCFLAGCCHGGPVAGGVAFPPPHPSAGVPLHPTPLYEATGLLALLALTLGLRGRVGEGRCFLLALVGYLLLRLGIASL